MPGTRSHESPPSRLLNKDAGSTPHQSPFLSPPASSDQMLASARPSSLGNAGADFVSLKLFPMSVETQHFHAEERIAARSIEARCSARVDQRRVYGDARAERPAQSEAAPRLRGIRNEHTLLGANGENDSIRHL